MRMVVRPWNCIRQELQNFVHSFPSPKVGESGPGDSSVAPKRVYLRKEQEGRWICKGPSEPNADRRSAVMSGGRGQAELSIRKFMSRVYLVRNQPTASAT